MKIERISENQIRCTLTRDDMMKRSLKLSELAYGSEKARNLFRDMMRQAELEVGFQAEDIPLMIEAIPYSEYVVLLITKVEDPEELDTKFSSFAPGIRDESAYENVLAGLSSTASEVLDLFRRIQDSVSAPELPDGTGTETVPEEETSYTRLFSFSTLDHVIRLAKLTQNFYDAPNSLYKDALYGTYLLIVTIGEMSREDYNRFCNLVTEYGSIHHTPSATQCFLEEHFDPIIKDHALQTLAALQKRIDTKKHSSP
ncbi:MAG: adaptor protein MecA [Lachnospiraceae bacterium]|nr:adaptor protein MecA [Lachnospiraceae bacterium]